MMLNRFKKMLFLVFLLGFAAQAFAGNAYQVKPLPPKQGATGNNYILDYNYKLAMIQTAKVGDVVFGNQTVTAVNYDAGTDTITIKTKSTATDGSVTNDFYSLSGTDPMGNGGNLNFSFGLNDTIQYEQYFARNADNSFYYNSNYEGTPNQWTRYSAWVDKNGNVANQITTTEVLPTPAPMPTPSP